MSEPKPDEQPRKPAAEMNEGPKAARTFANALQTVLRATKGKPDGELEAPPSPSRRARWFRLGAARGTWWSAGMDDQTPAQEPYRPQFRYTWEEWSEHAEWFLDQPEGRYEATLEQFRTLYRNPDEAEWKGRRFFYEMLRMQEMTASYPGMFDEFYAEGRVGLRSAHMVVAMWRMFGALPDSMVEKVPPPEAVLALARKSKSDTEGTQYGGNRR